MDQELFDTNAGGPRVPLRATPDGALLVSLQGAAPGGGGTSDTTEVTQLAVKAAVEGVNTKTPDPVRKQVIDEASASVTYIGEAPLGTATSAAAWRVKRITTAGALTTIEFSPANSIFNNRASLGYT